MSAALLFGTAVEQGINALLQGATDPEVHDAYLKSWSFQEVNKQYTHLTKATCIIYSESDFERSLLTDHDLSLLKEAFGGIDPDEEIKKLYAEKKQSGYAKMPEERKALFNYFNWLSLYRKGLLMLAAVKAQVLPNIEKVYSIQEKVTLANKEGDSIIGFADIVVKWKGIERPIVMDFKTSSRAYQKDAVLTSPQLTLYVHALSEKYQTRNAGYVVLYKDINLNRTKVCAKCGTSGTGKKHRTCDVEVNGERCHGEWVITDRPEAELDIIIDEIPERTE